MASPRTHTLRETSHAFCNALISPPPPSKLLSTYFSKTPKITEHGPSWSQSRLPFLHKTFSGVEACESYFTILSSILEMQLPADAFPSKDNFVVDAEANAVSVVGKGHFVSKKTGKGWDEEFVYRLSEFDGEGKIGWWEIWADPLSAWVAVGDGADGKDGEVEKDAVRIGADENEGEALEKLEEAGLGGS